MILFRQKYPQWWFDWNRELMRFTNRVYAYGALLSDVYPSTDEQQYVRLELRYPDAKQELNRWLPLVKWLLAIPHWIVLFFLYIGAFFAVVISLVRDRLHGPLPARPVRLRRRRDALGQPGDGVRGRDGDGPVPAVQPGTAYAVVMATDRYPPFDLD